MKSRFFRTGRQVFKTSEVLALFLLGIFGSFLIFSILVALDYAFRYLFGSSR